MLKSVFLGFCVLLPCVLFPLSPALRKADSTGRQTGVIGGKWLEGLSALERVYWVAGEVLYFKEV
ncbi:hypothetical protein HRbin16_01343 [bacterium HR16]|nr:hypothetical protein HRbin16_01343 [bacterium HR16]